MNALFSGDAKVANGNRRKVSNQYGSWEEQAEDLYKAGKIAEPTHKAWQSYTDKYGNRACVNCRNIKGCVGCTDCTDCNYCVGCKDCAYCNLCVGCKGCERFRGV